MYVVSAGDDLITGKLSNGAAAILSRSIRKQIVKRMGGNAYLLPSSIEEFIVCPEIKGEEKELLKMVYSINHSDIIPDSLFLSNSIYYLEENGDIRVITSEKMKP